MGEIDEGDVGSADEEGEEPDDEHHQQRVPCRQAGSQRVEDAHVPQQSDQLFYTPNYYIKYSILSF